MTNPCRWEVDDEDYNAYATSCERLFTLIEGTPKDNEYLYCPGCGGEIYVDSAAQNQGKS